MFRIKKRIKLTDFEKEKSLDLKKNKQPVLRGTGSVSYDNGQIHILYDFGDILILSNTYVKILKLVSPLVLAM
jgi:hypothetical protein